MKNVSYSIYVGSENKYCNHMKSKLNNDTTTSIEMIIINITKKHVINVKNTMQKVYNNL